MSFSPRPPALCLPRGDAGAAAQPGPARQCSCASLPSAPCPACRGAVQQGWAWATASGLGPAPASQASKRPTKRDCATERSVQERHGGRGCLLGCPAAAAGPGDSVPASGGLLQRPEMSNRACLLVGKAGCRCCPAVGAIAACWVGRGAPQRYAQLLEQLQPCAPIHCGPLCLHPQGTAARQPLPGAGCGCAAAAAAR